MGLVSGALSKVALRLVVVVAAAGSVAVGVSAMHALRSQTQTEVAQAPSSEASPVAPSVPAVPSEPAPDEPAAPDRKDNGGTPQAPHPEAVPRQSGAPEVGFTTISSGGPGARVATDGGRRSTEVRTHPNGNAWAYGHSGGGPGSSGGGHGNSGWAHDNHGHGNNNGNGNGNGHGNSNGHGHDGRD